MAPGRADNPTAARMSRGGNITPDLRFVCGFMPNESLPLGEIMYERPGRIPG